MVVDPGGPAASDSQACRVRPPSHRDHDAGGGEASALFYNGVAQGTLRHRGSAPLTQSVQGAVKRSLSQSWAFDRLRAISDPSPLMAATLAHFGLLTRGPISQTAFDERFKGDTL